ncbi:hypothetical protein BDZ97DRAFT_1743420 [Flammula alnicola]|nr:hypothetical protein BDZ97DRAFT_1743420 [Flammula alnicola]
MTLGEGRGKRISSCFLSRKNHPNPESLGGLSPKSSKQIQIDLEEWPSYLAYCLGGRATAVLGLWVPCKANLTYKIYKFGEVARENKGDTIEYIRWEIKAGEESNSSSKHLPDLLLYIRWHVTLWHTNVDDTRRRTSHFKANGVEGNASTDNSGPTLSKAWLEVVKCTHIILFTWLLIDENILLAQPMHSFGVAI